MTKATFFAMRRTIQVSYINRVYSYNNDWSGLFHFEGPSTFKPSMEENRLYFENSEFINNTFTCSSSVYVWF